MFGKREGFELFVDLRGKERDLIGGSLPILQEGSKFSISLPKAPVIDRGVDGLFARGLGNHKADKLFLLDELLVLQLEFAVLVRETRRLHEKVERAQGKQKEDDGDESDGCDKHSGADMKLQET